MTTSRMLKPWQITVARKILDWDQPTLAYKAGVSYGSVCRAESKGLVIGDKRITLIRSTCEAEGICFINGDDETGVVFRPQAALLRRLIPGPIAGEKTYEFEGVDK